MMKAIIYAAGEIFNRYQEKIVWDYVIAIADKNWKGVKEIRGVPMIAPQEIASLEYDYIAIFSDKWFEGIKQELVGEFFISPERIISWRDLLAEEVYSGYRISRLYQQYIEAYECKRILDFGMSVLPNSYLTKQEFLPQKEIVLDGIPSPSVKYNQNLYDHIYADEKSCDNAYDAVLVWELHQLTDEFWECCGKRARYVLFYTPYLLNEKYHREHTKAGLQKYGIVTYLSVSEGLFWCVELNPQKSKAQFADIAIYVVTHKEYNLYHDRLYRPLCVGDYQEKGFLTEKAGENISYLNPSLNECTALYWIWKNTSEQYVGLNHYRRYFYGNQIRSRDNYLNAECISKILREYDIIVTETCPGDDRTVFEQLSRGVDRELCKRGYGILRDKIAQKQPEYLRAFDDMLSGHNSFFCNMFVTRRDILNQYCEWLFSFLIDAADSLEVSSYDSYSQRLMGLFAERLMTVWISRQHLKIKELPWQW